MSIELSVVIPTYSRPNLLIKCLNALAAQVFNKDSFEVLVVTDGPDRQTIELVSKWLKKRTLNVRLYSLPYKKGPAAARNYGWLNARGHLVAFTDDDCVPDKNWLKAFAAAYFPKKNMAFTGRTTVPIPARPTDYELNAANLQTAEFITANCCCPKYLLEKAGGFDERFAMAWREDSDLEFKLLKENIRIIKVDSAVVIHPVRKAKWGVSLKDQKKTMYNALLYKKYPDLYRQKIQVRPQYNYYTMIAAFVIMLIGMAVNLQVLSLAGSVVWFVLTTYFICKRLSSTSLTLSHITEMVITSVAIPFLSVYWQFYGAIKYRVLFI